MVAEAEQRGLPLVCLRRGVPFVEVTEAIHSAILAGQLDLLRRGEAIHQRFTALMLDGEGVDTVVRALAETIGDPVILEDARGELLFHARHRTGDGDVIGAWEELRSGGDGPAYAVDLPTGDAGGPGRLVALGLDSPIDDFDRVAIERAAGVIALASLRTNQQQLLALRERGGFLAELAAGELAPREAAARAEGLAFTAGAGDGPLLPLAVDLVPRRTAAGSGPRRDAEERAAALAWRDVRRDLAARNLPALFGARADDGDVLALVALPRSSSGRPNAAGTNGTAGKTTNGTGASAAAAWPSAALSTARADAATSAADAIHRAVERHFGRGRRAIVVAGPAARGWAEAGAGLRAATGAVDAALRIPQRPWHDAAAPDLERLLAALRDHDALTAFVAHRLGPLLDHDARRKHHLLPTLEAFCANGGHKADTARALHLGRQALYHRLGRIEELLGSDLEDEDTRLGLHLAIRARRLNG
jgi:purine catabolism regulator